MIETIEPLNTNTLTATPTLPTPLQALERLSWNYWWSWSEDGPAVFRDLDPEIWEEYEQNPRLLLARTSEYRLAQMATDPVYVERVRRLAAAFDHYLEGPEQGSAIAIPSLTREHPVA